MKKITFDLNISLSDLVLTCLLAITFSGGLVYRLYKLNHLGISASLVLATIIVFILTYFSPSFNISQKIIVSFKKDKIYWLSLLFISLLGLLAISRLLSARTDQSIISPWESVPRSFFLLYFILLISVFFFAKKYKSALFSYLVYGIFFGVIILIYKIGYGYDFFIHGAALKLINETGEIFPKTNFYLGQYGLLIIIHKISGLSLYWLHKLLVPVLSIIFLPAAIHKLTIEKGFTSRNVATMFFLLLPLSFLTFTTPQNFGYLLLLLLVFNLWRNQNDSRLSILLVACSLLTHPITGIPALFLFLFYEVQKRSFKFKRITTGLLSLICLLILPLFFYLSNIEQATIAWPAIKQLIGNNLLGLPDKSSIFLNFSYLFFLNSILFVISILFVGYIINKKDQGNKLSSNLNAGLILFFSALVMSIINTKSLIDYEQADYAKRLFTVALIISLPYYFIAMEFIYKKISALTNWQRLSFLFLLASLVTANLYLVYPRHDDYYNSRGLSVGKADIEAVNWIENNSPEDYIVLANQQVSAAALHLFGFKKYYQNNIFYYPVPTSGPLYPYYLSMAYNQPDLRTIRAAMDLAAVKKGYFVINDYWYAFPKIIEEAKLYAKNFKSFDNGKVYVFEY